jgi:hypothetical protein
MVSFHFVIACFLNLKGWTFSLTEAFGCRAAVRIILLGTLWSQESFRFPKSSLGRTHPIVEMIDPYVEESLWSEFCTVRVGTETAQIPTAYCNFEMASHCFCVLHWITTYRYQRADPGYFQRGGCGPSWVAEQTDRQTDRQTGTNISKYPGVAIPPDPPPGIRLWI